MAPSLRWGEPARHERDRMTHDAVIDMGWGRLIFAHTFESPQAVADELLGEKKGDRDIAFYIRDPHVLLAQAPHQLFLDPSHTYRLWMNDYRPSDRPHQQLVIRRIQTEAEAREINRIYQARGMVTCDPAFMLDKRAARLRTYLVAENLETGEIVGTVTGVDHVEAFKDPENGCSLWCLAVDPQAVVPGVGQTLVRHLVEHYHARGRAYLDLSVMHDNREAIALYEKLHFRRVPVFCIKRKNPINEPLFVQPDPEQRLNVYAKIIVNEARRRGIAVEVLDADGGYFQLTMGGRTIGCRESLSQLTDAVAMSRCADKRMTRKVLDQAGVAVPDQILLRETGDEADEQARQFLGRHGEVVVKPLIGEQGQGITVGVTEWGALESALADARRFGDEVLVEQFVEGNDLRVIVIDFEVVAAAERRPPIITGTGQLTVRELIEKYNRRRMAATDGESKVPLDAELERVLQQEGLSLEDKLEAHRRVRVRKTANLHTGGTIHDVTAKMNPALAEASVKAARALDIPVVGLDLLVPDVTADRYVMIEANERPGLANHEPQPTAERFIDLLFPHSKPLPGGQNPSGRVG